jgi:hypothetical protein
VLISEKESEQSGKRGFLDGGGKRTPLLVECSTYLMLSGGLVRRLRITE